MKKKAFTNSFIVSTLTALALCSGCDTQGQEPNAQGDELAQVEEAYLMEEVRSDEYGVGLSFWLGTWDVTGEDCVEIRVIRHPDAPMQLDVEWLADDNQVLASRPVDLTSKISEAFKLKLSDYPGTPPNDLHLAGHAWFENSIDHVQGGLINTVVRPCRF